MELWTSISSLLVLQIIAAQEDWYSEEYASSPESYDDVSLSASSIYPQTEYLSSYLPPQIPPVQYIPPSSCPPTLPDQPDQPDQEYEEDVEISLPSLPDISLDMSPALLNKKYVKSYKPPPSYYSPPCPSYSPPSYPPLYPLYPYPSLFSREYFPPKFGFHGKCVSLCKKKPYKKCSLKEKCLLKKFKKLNKIVNKLLYKPEKKCSLCKYEYEYECPPYCYPPSPPYPNYY